MKLEGALTEVRRVTRASDPWTGDDFTCAQPEHDPATIDHAIATILNAVASGDLIPLADHNLAVAMAYQRAVDGVTAEFQHRRGAIPVDVARGLAYGAILALADADALAEVADLKRQIAAARAEIDSLRKIKVIE